MTVETNISSGCTKTAREEARAQILVVDDNSINRLKIRKAVKNLGHKVEVAANGAEAMKMLRSASYDAVLLDIVMPEMDGFEVLRHLKADDILREIPVIVISALDDDINQVVHAIELGAEDFLPKDFEPVLLRARLQASLNKKRFRDKELEYLSRVEKLTEAAQVIEAGSFTPDDLALDDLSQWRDALGGLATVFRGLAQEVYDREQRLDRTVRTLRGTLLVLLAGGIFGIAPALGRMAAGIGGYAPLGIVFWSSIVSAIVAIVFGVYRSGVPSVSKKDLPFLIAWAVISGCLYQVSVIAISAYVEATTISLVSSLRGFMVFGLAALIGLERANLRRFGGLGIGFVAIAAVLLFDSGSSSSASDPLWLIITIVLPLLLALHTILMTARPKHLDSFFTVGVMMVISALFILPFAYSTNALFLPGPSLGPIEWIIIVLGVSRAIALALALDLVKTAGAVFASQLAYSQTIAGIGWAMLLLGERLSMGAWLALALVILGVWLVEPRRASEKFRAKSPKFGSQAD